MQLIQQDFIDFNQADGCLQQNHVVVTQQSLSSSRLSCSSSPWHPVSQRQLVITPSKSHRSLNSMSVSVSWKGPSYFEDYSTRQHSFATHISKYNLRYFTNQRNTYNSSFSWVELSVTLSTHFCNEQSLNLFAICI